GRPGAAVWHAWPGRGGERKFVRRQSTAIMPCLPTGGLAAHPQQDGTLRPAASAFSALIAPTRLLTFTRRIPCGTAPAVSAQLPAGVTNTVAPARRAP